MEQSASSVKHFYLQDSRGNVGDNLMFWAENGNGYKSDIAAAGMYTEEEAFRQNASRPTDIPWPVDYLRGRVRPVVDMQVVKLDEANAFQGSAQFYLEGSPREFVGNDMLFVAKDGQSLTTDLTKAMVFARADVVDELGNAKVRGTPWPKAYIDMRSREAVDYRKVNLKDALKDVSSTLTREKRVASRHRCHGCGQFLTAEAYYTSQCGKCGTENRP